MVEVSVLMIDDYKVVAPTPSPEEIFKRFIFFRYKNVLVFAVKCF